VSRDLRALFAPRSVAVLGASSDPAKWGHVVARAALAGVHRRAVYLVNRKGGMILGRRAYSSLAELPEAPELVVVTVPAEGFEQAVEAALEAGARAIVAISAGLGELGTAEQERERAVVERVRAADAVLLGPNCLGVVDTGAELRLAWGSFRAGPVGLISQSGNLALEIGERAAAVGLGISRFASLGNQADLEAVDLLEDFRGHAETHLIALYVEDFRDGRAFARSAGAAVAHGKPVVLLTAGRSEAGVRAALSHTGALVSDTRAVKAAGRAAGIVVVSTPNELVEVAQALIAGRLARGPRVAVMGDGGGHNAVAADVVTSFGFALPVFSDALVARLAGVLPANATTVNPVDFAGGGEQDISSFPQVAGMLLKSDEVDAVLLTGYFGGYGGEAELEAAHGLIRASVASPVPLVVQTMYRDSAVARELRAGGVPVYGEIESAARALARMREHAEARMHPRRVPELPDPVPGAAAEGYWEARELIERAGVELAQARPARSLAEARTAAAELGYPVVLKALGLLHKSDAGGVVLGIENEAGLTSAFADIAGRLGPEEYAVERMAALAEGVEVIVGVRRDRRFGPIVVVGLGGLYAEIFRDAAVALAPIDEVEAEDLLRTLRGAPLLTGARGRPALAVGAAARVAARLSHLAAAHPDLDEIEINPLLVRAGDALGLDALILASARGG
jgi:acetate---CoA ligase (ADP-forming)